MVDADDSTGEERESLLQVPVEGGILPLFGTVIYPQTVTPLAISQQSAVQLVDEALEGNGMLTLVALRAERVRPREVGPEHCYEVGTVAVIHRLLRLPDNTLRIAAEGIERVRIATITATEPHLRGRFVPLPELYGASEDVQPLLARAIEQVRALSRFLPVLTDDLQLALANEESLQRVSYLLALSLAAHSSLAERQALLELDTVAARLDQLNRLLGRELARVHGRSPDDHGSQPARVATLKRRPELRDLPLVQEALEAGRLDGIRSTVVALLRDRFGDDARLAAVEARLEAIQDQAILERLALLSTRVENLQEMADAL